MRCARREPPEPRWCEPCEWYTEGGKCLFDGECEYKAPSGACRWNSMIDDSGYVDYLEEVKKEITVCDGSQLQKTTSER